MNKYIARQIIDDMKQRYPEVLKKLRVVVRKRKGHKRHEYGLFHKGRYDFEIVRWEKLQEKLEYLHRNALRADLAARMEDYTYSSARNYILGDNTLIDLDPLPI
ncbi:hypothetical protein GWO43_11370 [candidate division KSB1 bacterium]|nr:hypothetical protein [candidate division KSB1 bacterium]NIR70602.1 hypothetical protein [candidate division KSB1 bacterium]NIS24547.1 hypothetical protein [candidate division KSB1 bacterium]NIT71465.1 hypothetical protein [candidate division KSB1 bacterium]NIU25156.1 hypothetical protein [candidate division KSB1 bacterium]